MAFPICVVLETLQDLTIVPAAPALAQSQSFHTVTVTEGAIFEPQLCTLVLGWVLEM